ncbi:Serine carboxypeptidase-like 50 [Glycine max]|nr:Serine carboxypeptidase-like 50 [Glycine max]
MGNWSEATDARNKVLKMLQSMTGLDTLYDYTRKTPYEDDLVEQFLSIAEVKKALGINESFAYESCSDVVGDVLHADVMKSVKYMVEYLLSMSKVLLYQGQHDLRDGVVQTEVWVKTVKWEGIVEFLNSERKIWKVNGELARIETIFEAEKEHEVATLSLLFSPLSNPRKSINHPSTKQAQSSKPSLIPHRPFSLHHHSSSFKSTISANPLHAPLSLAPHRPRDPSNATALCHAALVWFRNDLRLLDNECLIATNDSFSVFPIYCFDPSDYGKLASGFDKTGPYRVAFLIDSVSNLYRSL